MKTANPTSSSAQPSCSLNHWIGCPFCGTRCWTLSVIGKVTAQPRFAITCDACGARGPERASEDAALQFWDKRASPHNIPNPDEPCHYCGKLGHLEEACQRIAAIEFHPGGGTKRVEFITPEPLRGFVPSPVTGILGPLATGTTATSSDDSPAPRPWPKVTWCDYADDGNLRAVDIHLPCGESVTMYSRRSKP